MSEKAVAILLKNKKNIYELTRFSTCADEIYKHTILAKHNIVFFTDDNNRTNDLRYIEWAKGNGTNPYIFRREDFNALIDSDRFFARKFDENVDRVIVDMIYKYVKTRK